MKDIDIESVIAANVEKTLANNEQQHVNQNIQQPKPQIVNTGTPTQAVPTPQQKPVQSVVPPTVNPAIPKVQNVNVQTGIQNQNIKPTQTMVQTKVPTPPVVNPVNVGQV